jgi:hypothetical protein
MSENNTNVPKRQDSVGERASASTKSSAKTPDKPRTSSKSGITPTKSEKKDKVMPQSFPNPKPLTP